MFHLLLPTRVLFDQCSTVEPLESLHEKYMRDVFDVSNADSTLLGIHALDAIGRLAPPLRVVWFVLHLNHLQAPLVLTLSTGELVPEEVVRQGHDEGFLQKRIADEGALAKEIHCNMLRLLVVELVLEGEDDALIPVVNE